MNAKFAEWATKEWFDAQPWYKRFWLLIRGWKPLCAHDPVHRVRVEVEHGKAGYEKHHTYSERFCPKCGEALLIRYDHSSEWVTWIETTRNEFYREARTLYGPPA